MVSTGTILILSPLIAALALVAYLWYDKNRVLIRGRDPATGKEYEKKARLKEEGVKWDHSRFPTAMIQPREDLMGTKVGLFWEQPLLRINARTGNQMPSVTVEEDPTPETLERKLAESTETANLLEDSADESPIHAFFAERSWPQTYWVWMDSEAMKQAAAPLRDKLKDVWPILALAFISGVVVTIMAGQAGYL